MDKKYRRANMFLAVLLFFVYRSKYIELSVNHQISLNHNNQALIQKFEEGDKDFIESTKEDMRINSTNLTKTVDESLWGSLFYIILVSLIALGIAYKIGSVNFTLPFDHSKLYAFTGSLLMAWATLMELGGKMQTWGGETLPELTHREIFKILFIPGTCLLLLGVSI